MRDPATRVTAEKIGDASVDYNSLTKGDSVGLKATSWGQMAIDFDPTGVLYRLGRFPAKWYSL